VRVGLIIYGSLDIVSGGYLYDRMLVEHLRQQGDEVDIIALSWRDYGRHLSDNLARALRRRLRHASLDVLLQDELNHPSLFWLNRWLRHQVRYPLVTIVHHLRCSEARPAWQNRLYRWVERCYLMTLDGLIFNSQTTAAAVERLIGARQASVVAAPGGDRLQPTLTPAQITARALHPGPLRVLFVGNLIPRKALHTLLTAVARLPHEGWQLEVVGSLTVDAVYVQAIRRQIAQAGLTRQVTLLGTLSDTDLAARLAYSHVLAVPSSYEGFGIVYLEGMGFGLPAVASTAGGASEIITHGLDGFLITPGDTLTLAYYLAELHQNRERLVQVSLAAHGRYQTHPTWAASAARIRQFLQTLVQELCPHPRPIPSLATSLPRRA
jgi:glycosyltransferase involved in cell wall biosynthesis